MSTSDRPWYRRPMPITLTVLTVGIIAGLVVRARSGGAPAEDTVTVTRRDVVREVRVTGTVASASEVALAFDIVGRIVRVGAEVGDVVRTGAELVALDASSMHAEFARAQAAL